MANKALQEIKLRPYQEKAIEAVRNGFIKNKSGLLVLPTGAGKTTVAAKLFDMYLTKCPDHKCFFIVHRQELYKQALTRFTEMGLNTTGWCADEKDASGSIVVIMKDSARNFEFHGTPGLYMVDEAHHNAADSYLKLHSSIAPRFTLGLTATPTRLDGKDLEFGVIFYQKTFYELVQEGWLSRPVYHRFRTDEDLDFHIERSDIAQKDLELLNNDSRNQFIVSTYVDNQEEFGKTLAFAVTLDHAKSIKHIFDTTTDVKCEIIYGAMPKEKRKKVIKDFADNKIDFLVNLAIAIEGFDDPGINSVFLCRPTASETYFMQMVGRGARLKAKERNSPLNKFNIVSFIDGESKLARLADYWSYEHLGGELHEESIETVREINKEKDKKQYKEFLKSIGTTKPLATIEKEVYKIVGAYIFTSRSGTRRFTVDTKRKLLFDDFIDHCRTLYANNHNVQTELAYYGFSSRHGHKKTMAKMNWLFVASAVFRLLRGHTQDLPRPPVEFVPFELETKNV